MSEAMDMDLFVLQSITFADHRNSKHEFTSPMRAHSRKPRTTKAFTNHVTAV